MGNGDDEDSLVTPGDVFTPHGYEVFLPAMHVHRRSSRPFPSGTPFDGAAPATNTVSSNEDPAALPSPPPSLPSPSAYPPPSLVLGNVSQTRPAGGNILPGRIVVLDSTGRPCSSCSSSTRPCPSPPPPRSIVLRPEVAEGGYWLWRVLASIAVNLPLSYSVTHRVVEGSPEPGYQVEVVTSTSGLGLM